MNRLHHAPDVVHIIRQIAVVPISARRSWRIALIVEDGAIVTETRLMNQHPDGRLSPTGHRSVFRGDCGRRVGEAICTADALLPAEARHG